MADDKKTKTTRELFQMLAQVKMYPIDRQPISPMPPSEPSSKDTSKRVVPNPPSPYKPKPKSKS